MLDTKTKELVAIGASVVANCQPCLDYHAEEARKAGASDSEMREAASIARMVREAGAEKQELHDSGRDRSVASIDKRQGRNRPSESDQRPPKRLRRHFPDV